MVRNKEKIIGKMENGAMKGRGIFSFSSFSIGILGIRRREMRDKRSGEGVSGESLVR